MYIAIRKVLETADFVEYAYGLSDEELLGSVRLNKVSGEVEVLRQLPNEENARYSGRVARKLWKHWTANEFPDNTCWAS